MKVIFILSLVLEVVKYVYVEFIFLKKNKSKYDKVGKILFLAAVFLAWIEPVENIGKNNLICDVIIFLGLLVSVEMPLKKKVIHIAKVMFFILNFDYIVELLMKSFGMTFSRDEINSFVCNAIVVAVLFSLYPLKKRWGKDISPKRQVLWRVIIYGCVGVMAVAVPMTISSMMFLAESSERPEIMRKAGMLAVISMLGYLMLILSVVIFDCMNNKMKKYLQMEKRLNNAQRDYYEAIIQKEEDTKHFRHDMLNHLVCIRELAERGELDSVKSYIEQTQGELIKIQKRCYSVGNTVLDGILNYYAQQLPENVEIKVSGCLKDNIFINDMELCTIFANIMSNSMEELKQQNVREKYLRIRVKAAEEDFRIEVSNSAEGKKKEGKDKLPVTTKTDKKNHGIGLKNIQQVVEKNHGIFRWNSTEDEFSVKVILPICPEN